jgi:hypothetical protein
MTDFTPPPELIEEWAHMLEQHTDTEVFTAAARWGADQARAALAKPQPAADVIARPIPVSERLPEAGDCDDSLCWQWLPDINGHHPLGRWERQHRDWLSDPDGDATHWLPFNALPLPSWEVE